jgi:hypothetical protein
MPHPRLDHLTLRQFVPLDRHLGGGAGRQQDLDQAIDGRTFGAAQLGQSTAPAVREPLGVDAGGSHRAAAALGLDGLTDLVHVVLVQMVGRRSCPRNPQRRGFGGKYEA